MQSRAVEMTRVLLWKGITFIIIIIIIIIINIIIINITGSLARKRGSRGLASSSSLSARDSATAYLTNERRVLRLLTNERRVLRLLTNQSIPGMETRLQGRPVGGVGCAGLDRVVQVLEQGVEQPIPVHLFTLMS